jgi:HD-GYP domain-containing protein (c-di-GMP phosphodiesterase class II)
LDDLFLLFKYIDSVSHLRDAESNGHGSRVSVLCGRLAAKLKMSAIDTHNLLIASKLHDMGKAAVDSDVLWRKGTLNFLEMEKIRKHAAYGEQIANEIGLDKNIAKIIGQHHERWDGTGYPKGLKGTEIVLSARVIAVVDSYDAMTSPRSYKTLFTPEQALADLGRLSGIHYDPEIVTAFVESMNGE